MESFYIDSHYYGHFMLTWKAFWESMVAGISDSRETNSSNLTGKGE